MGKPAASTLTIEGGRPDWVRNIQADTQVTLRIRGGTSMARGRLLDTAAAEHMTAASAYAQIVPFDYVTCVVHVRGIPTSAKVRRLLHDWFNTGTPVALELTAPP